MARPLTPSVPPTPLAALQVRGLSKVHGHGTSAVHALDGISLDVQGGEMLCIVGASGCGKSSFLNLVADLDTPSAGTIDRRGHVALIFQEAALFPWLTVRSNITLALKLRGVPRKDRVREAEQLLRTVHLHGFGHKRPHELSGGMRQRVAIARAFAQDADILLMDEPFGALDAMTRDLLHAELERLWADRNLTVVFVTHNVREAARLADRVVLLSSRPGRIVREFDVDIARPRRMDSPEVSSLAAQITDELKSEVRRHAIG
jgi:NitT/TauT family transport system ATP-binding protein